MPDIRTVNPCFLMTDSPSKAGASSGDIVLRTPSELSNSPGLPVAAPFITNLGVIGRGPDVTA
jgi:hypothetical protein